jgi:hypothetical protein
MSTAQIATSAYAVFDPATGKVEKEFDQTSDAEIADALARTHTAFTSWRRSRVKDRTTMLRRVADLYEERRDSLAAVVTREMGKPVTQQCQSAGAEPSTRKESGYSKRISWTSSKTSMASSYASGYTRLRTQRSFASIDDLTEQLRSDVEASRTWAAKHYSAFLAANMPSRNERLHS